MILPETFDLARRFRNEPLEYWLIGGNAIELVVDHDVRDHDDIDFMVAHQDALRAVQILQALGFEHAHGSLDDGDVFYRRGALLVDLVPVCAETDPPRMLGALSGLCFPAGFLTPYLATHGGEQFPTLSPRMHLQMKTVVAEFYGVPPREKDVQDVRALQAHLQRGRVLAGEAG
ncbi:nucleotidyltransferase domain-containing protein [Deinococcus peraridilitoris]|uniref:Aminoglycoside-2''-adenylyltransferase n=1 Tax=Deinococcus peraridilitoris (strain DSM 19664 / LMG 22246 / CIP 109416 / KR-200) TaxID=937777 RepID=L0A5S3_DEIPD|nr:nucleotidyltransferase family protein [Deinococcus peraridilitoris]AFZ68370.1 hypothetical protein Deipe_2909 [Deinococcus peraridilitoris DSM 19664]